MSLGLLLIGRGSHTEIARYLRVAEEVGFDEGWLADERFYREVYATLTYLATQTSTIRIGPCVTDPFARHPAMTAAAIATLDEISGGRALLGVGAGISGFAEMGIDRRKPAIAIREMIAVVRALLRGETVDFHGEVVEFNNGKLDFKPLRADIPIFVASNGPLGQKAAGAVADGALMEACASVPEVQAFKKQLARGAAEAGRDPSECKVITRVNVCISEEPGKAKDTLRPTVARYIGAARLRQSTLAEQGLSLPDDVMKSVAGAPYTAGVKPYLPLLPLITDRHVDALTIAGTTAEVTEHFAELMRGGVDSFIVMPFAPEGGTVDEIIRTVGSQVWPEAKRLVGRA